VHARAALAEFEGSGSFLKKEPNNFFDVRLVVPGQPCTKSQKLLLLFQKEVLLSCLARHSSAVFSQISAGSRPAETARESAP
jgi:hypothetical protein